MLFTGQLLGIWYEVSLEGRAWPTTDVPAARAKLFIQLNPGTLKKSIAQCKKLIFSG
jgi:hypothetical protein